VPLFQIDDTAHSNKWKQTSRQHPPITWWFEAKCVDPQKSTCDPLEPIDVEALQE
jgi:hypothetical protein